MKWEPIETAPKDGTIIIIARGVDVAPGWFSSGMDGVEWRFLDDASESIEGCCDRELRGRVAPNGWLRESGGPTHWMPLPEPPNDALKLRERSERQT